MISIQLDRLSISHGTKTVFSDLSIEVNDPTFIAVLGHNGSGKTSFFKALSGELAYTGTIYINGKKIKHNHDAPVAFLHQKNNLHFDVTVHDFMVMGLYRHKKIGEQYNTEDYQKVNKLAERLQITHLLNKNMQKLSGGEQQIIWLGQALLQDATIYLLDEPTQHLDIYNKRKVFNFLANLVEEYKKIVFCSTHDIYYLKYMKGSLLNFSSRDTSLIALDPVSIKTSIELLELNKQVL